MLFPRLTEVAGCCSSARLALHRPSVLRGWSGMRLPGRRISFGRERFHYAGKVSTQFFMQMVCGPEGGSVGRVAYRVVGGGRTCHRGSSDGTHCCCFSRFAMGETFMVVTVSILVSIKTVSPLTALHWDKWKVLNKQCSFCPSMRRYPGRLLNPRLAIRWKGTINLLSHLCLIVMGEIIYW